MMLRDTHFLLVFLVGLAIAEVVPVQAQKDQSGFISIDCGLTQGSNYIDARTGINYTSDAGFIDSGSSETISSLYESDDLEQQFLNVRSFPSGTRNCYTLRPLVGGKGNKYLIRARFFYGNYDDKSQPPKFDLVLGGETWDTVTVGLASLPILKEIIHVPTSDYIHVCLVNTGGGTPFISALELRPLNNSLYSPVDSSSLLTFARLDFGSGSNLSVRYKDDVYDRIWRPYAFLNTTTVSTSQPVDASTYDKYKPPISVMSNAVVPTNMTDSLDLWWTPDNLTDKYYMYLHFAEVVSLSSSANQTREFNIYMNDKLWYGPYSPSYLVAETVYSISPSQYNLRYEIIINRTRNSTLPPIINAIEIYKAKQFLYAQTFDQDVYGILNIKSKYGLKRNWQGDPCGPADYVWDGLSCSNDSSGSPRITSLNLSSSGLTGGMTPYIANLTAMESLDLSNNNLTGQVPDFLSELPYLKVLKLKGNNFKGPVPAALLAKSEQGSLTLSMDGNDIDKSSPCASGPCNNSSSNKKKKNKIIVPVVASVAAFIVLALMGALVVFWINRRRKQQVSAVTKVETETNNKMDEVLEVKNRQFTYSDILNITGKFQRVIGKGGFGTVYHGYVSNSQVAVKMLSPSSVQGHKEFQAEASLLISVHHKNLMSLVGYCNEGTNMGIIYEYMANGSLERHLSDSNPNVLSWEERLRIALDAAQGLEYLHHGCKPPIVHRDVKTTNILLDDRFQAKLADFGLSRAFPVEGGTHVSTVIAGTPGYLDPEYYTTSRLTEKSDVYSFGIVLLEIITSRPAIGSNYDQAHITTWVNSMVGQGDVTSIVDHRLRGDFDVNSVWKALELAMACVSRNSSKRPSMNNVVTELKECLGVEISYHQKKMVPKESAGLISLNLETGLTPRAR